MQLTQPATLTLPHCARSRQELVAYDVHGADHSSPHGAGNTGLRAGWIFLYLVVTMDFDGTGGRS